MKSTPNRSFTDLCFFFHLFLLLFVVIQWVGLFYLYICHTQVKLSNLYSIYIDKSLNVRIRSVELITYINNWLLLHQMILAQEQRSPSPLGRRNVALPLHPMCLDPTGAFPNCQTGYKIFPFTLLDFYSHQSKLQSLSQSLRLTN